MEKTEKNFWGIILKLKENKTFIFLLLSLVLGIVIGSLEIKSRNATLMDKLSPYFNVFIENETNSNFVNIVFLHIKFILPYFLIAFLLGFSAVGFPMIFILPFMIGLNLGTISGLLYNNYQFLGFGYSTIILSVPYALTALSLILVFKESVRLSSLLFFVLKSENVTELNLRLEVKLNFFRQFFFLLFLILSAFIKALFTVMFRGAFPFL